MSPAHLEILMWCYTRQAPPPNHASPWVQVLLSEWEAGGIVVRSMRTPEGWDTTDKGNAWCQLILETPVPVNQWVDPRKP